MKNVYFSHMSSWLVSLYWASSWTHCCVHPISLSQMQMHHRFLFYLLLNNIVGPVLSYTQYTRCRVIILYLDWIGSEIDQSNFATRFNIIKYTSLVRWGYADNNSLISISVYIKRRGLLITNVEVAGHITAILGKHCIALWIVNCELYTTHLNLKLNYFVSPNTRVIIINIIL